MKKPGLVIFTRYSRLGASSRLRFFQFLPFLEFDFHVSVFPLFDDEYLENLYKGKHCSKSHVAKLYVQRFFQLLTVFKYDLVWIEKELFPFLPNWAEVYLSLIKKPYIVDYDDAIFHNYDLSTHLLIKIYSTKIDKVMNHAALVTVGNRYLAERAVKASAKNIEIIPTVIDINRYSVVPRVSTNDLTIGWIGSPSTIKYLTVIDSVLKKLALNYDFTLRIIGAELKIDGVNIVCIPWTEETEVGEIQKFDIGIMPLADSPWERGKCGYKLIQYMACGIPVIASDVGINSDIIKKSESGFLASSDEEWFLSLDNFISDVSLRNELGFKGRKAVEQMYSVQAVVPRLLELLKKQE